MPFISRSKTTFAAKTFAMLMCALLLTATSGCTSAKNEMQAILKDHGVTLIGAGKDEAPMAYKDIHQVMAAQEDLVDVVAKFTPKMVRMADDGSRED